MKNKTLKLIMLLSPGCYGELGSICDVHPAGFAEEAEKYQEETGNSFMEYNFTGELSDGVYVTDILNDGSLKCLLDDKCTKAVIEVSSLEDIWDLMEKLYSEYITRLEAKQKTKFTSDNEPDYDPTTFAEMLREEPFYFKFDIQGFFDFV